jgi:cardiolipin synthase
MTIPDDSRASSTWTREQLFFSGDDFFGAGISAIAQARSSVVLEAYIFATDALGKRVIEALVSAAGRGVSVRVVVDGIGSPGWKGAYASELQSAGVQFHIFNEPPWAKWGGNSRYAERLQSFGELIRRINTRNHRKLLVVDGQHAFLGGMNVWVVHLESISGSEAWRDNGLLVEGPGLADLLLSFEIIWERGQGRMRRLFREIGKQKPLFAREDVLVNSLRRNRKKNYRLLLSRIADCKEKLWVTSAYFVPPGTLLKALSSASKRGVDVRVLVPRRSDVFFMPWVASALYQGLIRAGAKVFEYQPRILHAKTIQGDSWAIVGSSNMNHRSLMRDLEVDVVLRQHSSLAALSQQYEVDLRESRLVTEQDYRERPLWVRMASRLMLRLRSFL